MTEIELYVPYARGDLVAALHRRGEVIAESHDDGGTRLRVRLPRDAAAEFSDLA
jgi:GTP-binding protein HflX